MSILSVRSATHSTADPDHCPPQRLHPFSPQGPTYPKSDPTNRTAEPCTTASCPMGPSVKRENYPSPFVPVNGPLYQLRHVLVGLREKEKKRGTGIGHEPCLRIANACLVSGASHHSHQREAECGFVFLASVGWSGGSLAALKGLILPAGYEHLSVATRNLPLSFRISDHFLKAWIGNVECGSTCS